MTNPKNGLSYLNSLSIYRVKPGLHRIIKILEALGNPHDKIPSFIIGGTNGKGSVAAAISSILQASGYKAALYTSPHLVRLSERIKIKGGEIALDDLSRLILDIQAVSNKLSEEPSYFEVLTAAAFLYFAESKVDFTVLEVGMGGKWDATNITTPLVSVITNISKDHTEFLGESIREIALEKAGIIRAGIPVITGARGEALEVIEAAAREKSAPISVIGRDFKAEGKSTEGFEYHGQLWNLNHLQFSLPGIHQIENASIALSTFESLSRFHGITIKEKDLRAGLTNTHWEGRLEFLRKSPPLILDGAHNPGGAGALRKALEVMFPGTKFTFLIGMVGNKDHEEYLKNISPLAEAILITNVPSERNFKAEHLARIAGGYIKSVEIIEKFEEAFNKVRNFDSPVCVTGSLYLIGAIKGIIEGNN